MRGARILIPVLVALAAAGCLRRSSPYHAVDAATGQSVQMVQGYDPAAYQPAPAPQSYAQADSRALYGSPQAAQEQYGAPVVPEGYAPPSERSSGRGLFNSRRPSAQAQYAQPEPQYPYVPNMTVENAVAVAGGFSPRAAKRTVELTRNADGQQYKGDVPLNYPMRPGDTIVVKERWF
jgi:hypothetical protein